MVMRKWIAFKLVGMVSGVNLNSMVDKYPRARPEWYTILTLVFGTSKTSCNTLVSVIIPAANDLVELGEPSLQEATMIGFIAS